MNKIHNLTVLAMAMAIAGSASAATVNEFRFQNPDSPITATQFKFKFDDSWYSNDLLTTESHTNSNPPPVDLGPGKEVNLVTLAPSTGVPYHYHDGDQNDTYYAVYRQPNSAVIGYLDSADGSTGGNYFVKNIVGNVTPLSALPTSGTYTYTGSTLWHHVDSEGTFTYNINFATKQGWGRVEGLKMHWDLLGQTQNLSIEGNLATATIALQSDGTVGVKNGSVTNFTTNNVWGNLQLLGVSPKYDLAIFGPNAEEVAGRVTINNQYGSFGIAGAR
ncbi:MAG: factor H binding family protein [Pseudoxanthomonas sp.]